MSYQFTYKVPRNGNEKKKPGVVPREGQTVGTDYSHDRRYDAAVDQLPRCFNCYQPRPYASFTVGENEALGFWGRLVGQEVSRCAECRTALPCAVCQVALQQGPPKQPPECRYCQDVAKVYFASTAARILVSPASIPESRRRAPSAVVPITSTGIPQVPLIVPKRTRPNQPADGQGGASKRPLANETKGSSSHNGRGSGSMDTLSLALQIPIPATPHSHMSEASDTDTMESSNAPGNEMAVDQVDPTISALVSHAVETAVASTVSYEPDKQRAKRHKGSPPPRPLRAISSTQRQKVLQAPAAPIIFYPQALDEIHNGAQMFHAAAHLEAQRAFDMLKERRIQALQAQQSILSPAPASDQVSETNPSPALGNPSGTSRPIPQFPTWAFPHLDPGAAVVESYRNTSESSAAASPSQEVVMSDSSVDGESFHSAVEADSDMSFPAQESSTRVQLPPSNVEEANADARKEQFRPALPPAVVPEHSLPSPQTIPGSFLIEPQELLPIHVRAEPSTPRKANTGPQTTLQLDEVTPKAPRLFQQKDTSSVSQPTQPSLLPVGPAPTSPTTLTRPRQDAGSASMSFTSPNQELSQTSLHLNTDQMDEDTSEAFGALRTGTTATTILPRRTLLSQTVQRPSLRQVPEDSSTAKSIFGSITSMFSANPRADDSIDILSNVSYVNKGKQKAEDPPSMFDPLEAKAEKIKLLQNINEKRKRLADLEKRLQEKRTR